MEKFTITFLGTGNAVPTKLRNHTAILIEFLNEHILIDCGEGTQRQFKIAGLSPSRLTRLLITHWHGDHVLGIPGLFQTLAMADYAKTLEIYGPKNISKYIGLLQDIFHEFKISTHVHEVSDMENSVDCVAHSQNSPDRESYKKLEKIKRIPCIFVDTPAYCIESAAMNHGTPTNAYSIILKDRRRLDKTKLRKLKLPNTPQIGELQAGKDIVFEGKKIRAKDVSYIEKGKKITVILDTGLTDTAIKLAKNSDLLICESTFSSEEKEKAKEYLHLTSVDAATIAKKAKVKSLILTHISQRYEHAPEIILSQAKKVFKNTSIVKDLDRITL